MWERNLNQKLIIIALVTVFGVVLIYPPSSKLKPGLDIAGGFSLILEIEENEEGVIEPGIAEQMKTLLQRRLDPAGTMETRWAVIGENRIEVQVPLPPQKNAEAREAYLQARDALFAQNVERSQIESQVLLKQGGEREAGIRELSKNHPARASALQAAAKAWDAYQAIRAQRLAAAGGSAGGTSAPAETQAAASQPDVEALRLAERRADEDFSDALDAVLATNLDVQHFEDTLELDPRSDVRQKGLSEFKQRYPHLADSIQRVIDAYDAWKAQRIYLESPADLVRLLRGAGELEFRILAPPARDNPTLYDRLRRQLAERGPRPARGDTEAWFRIDNPVGFLQLRSPGDLETLDPRQSNEPFVFDRRGKDWYVLAKLGPQFEMLHTRGEGEWRLKRAGLSRDSIGRRCVTFEMDATGATRFRKLTSENLNQQLCIFIDDVAYSAANIAEAIGAQGQITGDFSTEKLTYLLQTMQAGALPGRLKDTPVSERTVGSSLGAENLRKAFVAGIFGFIIVVLTMVFYYGLSGGVAIAALLLNVLLVLAAMALIQARFSLAGIAGVILTIGMAVDANVLIYERMREEKERGSSLRMIIKNGYDKALSTIVDSNLTTLLSCLILYYVGSEEIKGFGLTLGWGIAINLFSALFMTHAVFALLVKYNLIKQVNFRKWVGVPTIDWYGLRKVFLPVSFSIMAIGLALLILRGKRDTLDVEFLGGVNAEIELKAEVADQFNDVVLHDRIAEVGRQIAAAGAQLANAKVVPVGAGDGRFRVEGTGIEPDLLAAMITEPLQESSRGTLLRRNGIERTADGEVLLSPREGVSAASLETAIRALAGRGEGSVTLAGDNLARANIGYVIDPLTRRKGQVWNLTTTETNKALVQYALRKSLGDNLKIQPRILHAFRHRGDNLPYPITDRQLATVIPSLPQGVSADLTDFVGGAAFWFDQLNPPQTLGELDTRLKNMRLQPDFQDLPYRKTKIVGVHEAGKSAAGEPLYDSIVIAVADNRIVYDESADIWATGLAGPELRLMTSMLDNEQALRKVTQFKPQIAAQATTRAGLAILLSWIMIIFYIWLRFGRPIYGVAGVVALVHDVVIALAFIGLSGWIGGSNHPIGALLLIDDFKIDMTIVAAFLTIIGYSINDKIVIFDRIRELRGRLGVLTPELINSAISQTLSRTLMTGLMTLQVLLMMYVFGGGSMRGFAACMLVGILTGTYSSIGIAAPLLLAGTRAMQRGPAGQRAVATAG